MNINVWQIANMCLYADQMIQVKDNGRRIIFEGTAEDIIQEMPDDSITKAKVSKIYTEDEVLVIRVSGVKAAYR